MVSPAQSLTTRLVLLLTLTIVVTLTCVTVVDYLDSRARILAEQDAQVEATVGAAVRNLEVRLSVLEESTELLAEIVQSGSYTEPELRAILWEAVDDRDDLFGAALALHPRFSSDPESGFAPYYYYRDGELAYSDLADEDYDYALRSWFREAASTERPVWTEPYYDEGGGNVHMVTYAVPMFREADGQREVLGVVTADIKLDDLQYYLQRMELGKRGFGFMLSRSGRIIASPNPQDWLKPWAGTIQDAREASRWASLVTRVAAGEATSARVACFDLGDDCTVRLAPLATTRWPVGAYYAEHEILAPLREYLTKNVLSQLLTLALLLIGITWVSRSITRPLRSLAAATVDIASGNFHTRLPATRRDDELGHLVQAFSLMQDNLRRYVEELQEQTASRNRLEGELNAATAIQMSMLPSGGHAHIVEDRFKLWAALRPAKSVGGDFYTFYQQGSHRLFVAVGDVSDKGVPAALFMARAMTLLQQYVVSELDAAAIMARLNDQLVEGNDNCMFVTLFIGWLDLVDLQMQFASGGHTAPALLRNARVTTLAQSDGPALGLAVGLEFPLNRVQLLPDDRLAVFTDGIDEAFNANQEQFGLQSINKILEGCGRRNLEATGHAILSAVDAHQGDVPQSDDITLLLLQPRGDGSKRTRITLVNDLGAVSTLQAWLGQLLGEAELADDILAEARLVAEEVVTNVFKYGQLSPGEGVTITLELAGDRLLLDFSDRGIPFDPLAEAERSQLGADIESAAIGGLGVHLIEGLTDEQHYRRADGENQLRLVKYLGER
jgi:sigma-B regulation protein RsbU (phosphoserine phosphatase)